MYYIYIYKSAKSMFLFFFNFIIYEQQFISHNVQLCGFLLFPVKQAKVSWLSAKHIGFFQIN